MGFFNIFRDSNDINEKSVIGFMSFGMMVLASLADIIGDKLGIPLNLDDGIYNSFVIITLGALGISGVEKVMRKPPEDEIG